MGLKIDAIVQPFPFFVASFFVTSKPRRSAKSSITASETPCFPDMNLDMALWLIGQIYNVNHARAVQRFMEYDPAPPYTADV